MSHFTVLVIGNNPEKQLEPYNENISIDPYVKYTKEQLIEKCKKEIEDYKNGMYAEFLFDPDGYKARHKDNVNHLNYIENEFPLKLNWTDEELYADEIKDYEKSDVGPNGEVYSTYNKKSKWDWYSLGGRWTGFFKVKQKEIHGVNILPAHKQGRPGIMTESAKEGYADQLLKRNIDIDFMRNTAREKAEKRYDLAMSILNDLPINKSWEEIREENKPKIDLARTLYHDQVRVKAWKEASEKNDEFKKAFGYFSSCDDFLITKEQYIQNAIDGIISTFAILYKGEWYERGEMGWWGIAHNEKDVNTWNTEFTKIWNELPDDTLISVYDCHI